MSTDHSTMRIGDAEREQSVALLGRHLAAGRLSMAEFESRLDVVYAARTGVELAEVLADLPQSEPVRRSSAPSGPRSWAPAWAAWALTGVICLLIWTVTSLAQGRPAGFWPFWVIAPWGVVLLARAGTRVVARRTRDRQKSEFTMLAAA